MARPHTCHNTREGLQAPTNGNNTFVPIFAVCYAPTPVPAQASSYAPDSFDKYMDEHL